MRTSAVLLALVCSAAQAEVYRCDKDGKTVFTDRPCHAEAQPEALREPNRVTATPGERKLASQYDRRLERERKARDRADRQWVKDRDASDAQAARIRQAIEQHKAVRGMTPDQVQMALGRPESVETSSGKQGDIEQWTYRADSDGRKVVTFRDGVVSTASSSRKKRKKK